MPRVGLTPETTALGRSVTGLLAVSLATTTATVAWQWLGGAAPVTVTLEGDFSGTARVLVSNDSDIPDGNDFDKPQIGTDLSGKGTRRDEGGFLWIGLYVPVRSSGTITRCGVHAGATLA